MTTNKDLKRIVRARMKKTGESYTAARAQVVRKKQSPTPRVSPADYAKTAGMSDKAVQAKTGRTWAQWVRVLDRTDATSMSHRDIAKHLRENHEITSWWCQTVTVGYERIRGLRAKGQGRDGSFAANKSRTFPVPLSTLYRAWSTARMRRRWMSDAEPTVRTSTVDKSVRFTWEDGTSVQAWFVAKGDNKSQVQIQHSKLRSDADIQRRKAYWTEQLTALGAFLRGDA